MSLRYISLGHRCHITEILKLNNLRNEALPFDSIIYSFGGVINCFETKFANFFPKKIECEHVFVGASDPEADINGNRKLFRGKFGSFPHHDLSDKNVRVKFRRRIQRLHQYLSAPHGGEVIFLRTVMADNNEINLINKFINTIKRVYPKLKFRLFLIFDNKNIPEVILKYNPHAYIVNSTMETSDQNLETNPTSYQFLFNYLQTIKTLNDIKIDKLFSNCTIQFRNDSYKGYAITNLLPYRLNN